jgi:prepilin-type N-terminal cleavage/methylation domain-containing protein
MQLLQSRRRAAPGGAAGFTMIEILVVIAIIGVLLVILAPRLIGSRTAGERKAMAALLQQVRVAIKAYADNPRYGDLPSTSAANAVFATVTGASLAPNDVNLGIESLVLHFHNKEFDGESPFASRSADFINTDGDSATPNVTSFGTSELFEFKDTWGNPLVYFRLRDFADRNAMQRIQLADGSIVQVAPIWDDKLKRMAGYDDGFQIISLGPDGVYGTDDDVRSFD